MTTSTVADRKAALEQAHGDARASLSQLEADLARAESETHAALVAGEMQKADVGHSRIVQLRADVAAKRAAADTIGTALDEVAREAAETEHRSQRDALSDSVAATASQLASLIDDARGAARRSRELLVEAERVEHLYAELQHGLHTLNVTLGDDQSRTHVARRPVHELLSGRPLLHDIALANPDPTHGDL